MIRTTFANGISPWGSLEKTTDKTLEFAAIDYIRRHPGVRVREIMEGIMRSKTRTNVLLLRLFEQGKLSRSEQSGAFAYFVGDCK